MPYSIGALAIDPGLVNEGYAQGRQAVEDIQADEAKRKQDADIARIQQTVQAAGGNYDVAEQELRKQGYVAAADGLAKAHAAQVKSLGESMKTMADARNAELTFRVHALNGVTDDSSYQALLHSVRPEDQQFYRQMIGDSYDPNKAGAFTQSLMSEGERNTLQKNAFDQFWQTSDPKHAAAFFANAKTPEEWQHATELARFRAGKAIEPFLSYLGDFSPEAVARAGAIGGAKEEGGADPWKGWTGPLKFRAQRMLQDTGRDINQPLQLTAKELDALQKESAQATHITVSGGGGAGGAGGLTKGEGGGLEYAGTLTRILGRVPVGLARSGGNATAAINEAARQIKILGQRPVDAMLRSAIYQGDAKALGSIQKMHGAADAYEQKALKQLDIVDGLSDKVGRTKFPILNNAIVSGKVKILGDDDATLLLNAILTASTEYAKIMMGGTASAAAITDSAQKEAEKLLNAGMSQGTLRKATALMRKEMDLTMSGFEASEQHIAEKLGAAAGAPPTAAPQGTVQKWVRDKNGKLVPQ